MMANPDDLDDDGLKSYEMLSVTLLNVANESGLREYKRLSTR